MNSFLRLSGVDLSSVPGGIKWMDGPQDIILMLKVDKDGQIDESILTDGVAEIDYQYTLPINPQQSRTESSRDYMVALVKLKNTTYVFTRNTMRISRTINLEQVLPLWIGIQPALAIADTGDDEKQKAS